MGKVDKISKHEILNTKQIQITEIQNSKNLTTVCFSINEMGFEYLNLEIKYYLGFSARGGSALG